MSVSWTVPVPWGFPLLGSAEGELVLVRIRVAHRLLEDLLEALAGLSFPINPQIYHSAGPKTLVEFPAYTNRLPEVRAALSAEGLDPHSLDAVSMLASFSI
ncbi:MAG TPA: hypothetical protein DEH78_09560 [Solibacterales bacterium]|nr:hypothetical protein [Bryobacterales bacterium]